VPQHAFSLQLGNVLENSKGIVARMNPSLRCICEILERSYAMASQWSDVREELVGTLTLPLGESYGGGFVSVSYRGHSITAEFTAAKVDLILVLNGELMADEDRHPIARGWRSAETISSLLAYQVEEPSLRKAVSEINGIFQEAAQRDAPTAEVPPLLGTKRQIGIRLNWQLNVESPEPPTPA